VEVAQTGRDEQREFKEMVRSRVQQGGNKRETGVEGVKGFARGGTWRELAVKRRGREGM